MRRLIVVCFGALLIAATAAAGHASANVHYRGVSSLASDVPDGVTCGPCTLSGRSFGASRAFSAETFQLSSLSGASGSASADIWQAWGTGTWSASGRRGTVSGTLDWTQSFDPTQGDFVTLALTVTTGSGKFAGMSGSGTFSNLIGRQPVPLLDRYTGVLGLSLAG